jgi:hypothetical protein
MNTKLTFKATLARITSVILFISLSTALSAQKKKDTNESLPPFGTVSKEDLELKTCEFDEKAGAMVLLDEGHLEYVFGKGMDLKRRVRIKILSNKGLEWANVSLKYHSYQNDEDITGLEAQSYNLDGSGNVVITKVEKKLIYEKKLNKRYTERVFTFPEVRVGSIIEYKYKHTAIGLIDWYFQRSIPVRHSNFTIDFPQEIEVSAQPFTSHQYDFIKEDKSTRIVQRFSMKNIPGLRDEPYIINEDYYRDRLITKVSAYNINGKYENRTVNWLQVIKFLMSDEDFGIQLKKTFHALPN